MTDLGKTNNRRGGRPETDPAYQKKVFEFMIVHQLEGRPREVRQLLRNWVRGKRGGIWNIPSYTTIHRLMKKFQKDPPMKKDLQKPFHYPNDMNQIGWEHGRVPLECLRYYAGRFGVRPAVGLVLWFCRMAEARESDLSDPKNLEPEASQIGLYAEIYWFYDWVKALGKPTPDLTGLELRLTWKSWMLGPDDGDYRQDAFRNGVDPDEPLLDAKPPYWLLLTDMPTVMDYLPRVLKEALSPLPQKKTEDTSSTVYLGEEDFSWYTKNILEKFPDLQ